jgi:hypothetical protein
MTLKVDGTNGILQAYDYQVLTTGFSYTFAAGTQTLVINPAGTLATGTITMPASPADGMVINIESTQQITAVTVQGNTGQTITGAPVQLIPNQPLSFMYNLANTKWQPFAGGAGRATALVSGTAVASTSGTSIDFTSIPSWVKRITVMFNGVSTNSTSFKQIQFGTLSGVETSGYVGAYAYGGSGAGSNGGVATTGFVIGSNVAAETLHGSFIFSLLNSSTNLWAMQGSVANSTGTFYFYNCAGTKALAGTLDRVRITTVNGTDTFDAGSINILYE